MPAEELVNAVTRPGATSALPGAGLLTGGTLLAAGLAALLLALATVLCDWRRRVRIWHATPERLAEQPPDRRRVFGLVVAATIGVGLAGLFVPNATLTPIGVLLAAYACLVAGHCRRSNLIGGVGLGLVAEALTLMAVAWLPESPARGPLGLALAGLLMLWLARFWSQQLNDGRPWTTAGRLIPVARRVSVALVGVQIVWALTWLLSIAQPPTMGGWPIAATLLTLLHWWRLGRGG